MVLLFAFSAAADTSDAARAALERGDLAAWTQQIDLVRAAPDQTGAAQTIYELAREADEIGSTALALHAYKTAVSIAPSARFARHAGTRIRMLEQATEGGADDAAGRELAELRAMLATNRDEALARMIERLDANTLATPDRAALLYLAAGELATREDRIDESWERYAELALLEGAAPTVRRAAFDRAIFLARDARRIGRTAPMIDAFVATQPLEPHLVVRAHDELLDHRLRAMADASIPITFTLFGVLFVVRRGWRGLAWRQLRAASPWKGILFLIWLFGFAAIASERWFHGNLEALLACIPVLSIAYILALAVGRTNPLPAARPLIIATGIITGAATFSAIYLTMRTFERTAMLGM